MYFSLSYFTIIINFNAIRLTFSTQLDFYLFEYLQGQLYYEQNRFQ